MYLEPLMMNILANDQLCECENLGQWNIFTDWICDLDLAGPSGEVELMGSIVMADEQMTV